MLCMGVVTHTPLIIDERILVHYIDRHVVLILRVQAAGEVLGSLFLPAHVLNAIRLEKCPPFDKWKMESGIKCCMLHTARCLCISKIQSC